MRNRPSQMTVQMTANIWSALAKIRRKDLLSFVGFRKRMTSHSPRGIYFPVTHLCFCFVHPL